MSPHDEIDRLQAQFSGQGERVRRMHDGKIPRRWVSADSAGAASARMVSQGSVEATKAASGRPIAMAM